MVVPDVAIVAEVMLFAEGFSAAPRLARKMADAYATAAQQLSKQARGAGRGAGPACSRVLRGGGGRACSDAQQGGVPMQHTLPPPIKSRTTTTGACAR